MSKSRREQVEEVMEELGVDADLDSDAVDVEGLKQEPGDLPDFVEAVSISVSTAQGYHPAKGSLDDVEKEFLLSDGSRVTVSVKRRPQCPSCQYLWGSDKEIYNHVFDQCNECGDWVCGKCWTECEACDTKMCTDCTMGHGAVDETYCPACRVDVQKEVEHSRELEEREQRHKQNLDKWEAKLEEFKQKRRILLEEEDAEHGREMEKLDKMIELARMINESDADADEVRSRLQEDQSDPFPSFGSQFSGMDSVDESKSEEGSGQGYSYDEVFE